MGHPLVRGAHLASGERGGCVASLEDPSKVFERTLMINVEPGSSVTQIKEPFSASCLAYGVTKGAPKPCDAELIREGHFSQRARPPRGLPGGVFSLCK